MYHARSSGTLLLCQGAARRAAREIGRREQLGADTCLSVTSSPTVRAPTSRSSKQTASPSSAHSTAASSSMPTRNRPRGSRMRGGGSKPCATRTRSGSSRTRSTPPQAQSPRRRRDSRPVEADDAGGVNHLIQLVGPVQESWLATLAERGIRLVEAVSPHAYYVRADAETVTAAGALPFVEWTGPLAPAYKVNPELLARRPRGRHRPGPRADRGGRHRRPRRRRRRRRRRRSSSRSAAPWSRSRPSRPMRSAASRRSLPTEALPDDRRARRRAMDRRGARARARRRAQRADRLRRPRTATAAPNTLPEHGLRREPHGARRRRHGRHDRGVRHRNRHERRHDDARRPRRTSRLRSSTTAGAAVVGADTDGHGTHVAGIAAGNGDSGDVDPQGFLLGQGVAPGADVGLVELGGTVAARVQAVGPPGRATS